MITHAFRRLKAAFSCIGRYKRLRIALWCCVGIVGIPLVALFMLPYVLWVFAPPLDPSVDLYAANRPRAFTFVDQQGDVVGRRGAIVGQRLKLDQMPAYLPDAFVAMEDRRFYNHIGIDSVGLLRAAVADLRAGHIVAGGSTITQQTAKIVFTNSKRNIARKLKDMLYALALEKAYSKKQILELYLNRIYLGSGAYGVDGAAHIYFGKSAKNLTLAQAAMLATLTRAPSVFSPRRDLKKAQQRASVVLSVMVHQGVITREDAAYARAHPARVTDRSLHNARNYFLDQAAAAALQHIAATGQVVDDDLTVVTTLEPRIQNAVVHAAEHYIRGKMGQRRHAHEMAAVVMKPNGAVAALIGGGDYAESPFNRATQAHRQPGSAFKPFVYMAALEAGMRPSDVREDEPVTIGTWTPHNFGHEQYGTVTLDQALTHSINTVAVQLAQEVGVSAVISAAKRCGITSPLRPTASLALGTSEVTPLEMTRAYATFANGGKRVQPYFITEVKDARGRVLYQRTHLSGDPVIARHVLRDLTGMMYDVVVRGTGHHARLAGHEAAGKTGTTQDYRDAWFVGFTADYVAGVWVGNDDSTPMRGVTGGTLPAYIWHAIMGSAEKGLPATPLDRTAPEDMDTSADTIPDFQTDESSPDETVTAPEAATKKKKSGFWDWLFGSDDDDTPSESPEKNGN